MAVKLVKWFADGYWAWGTLLQDCLLLDPYPVLTLFMFDLRTSALGVAAILPICLWTFFHLRILVMLRFWVRFTSRYHLLCIICLSSITHVFKIRIFICVYPFGLFMLAWNLRLRNLFKWNLLYISILSSRNLSYLKSLWAGCFVTVPS